MGTAATVVSLRDGAAPLTPWESEVDAAVGSVATLSLELEGPTPKDGRVRGTKASQPTTAANATAKIREDESFIVTTSSDRTIKKENVPNRNLLILRDLDRQAQRHTSSSKRSVFEFGVSSVIVFLAT